jgi:DNA repair protein RecO (recombination protein O)
MQSPQHRLRTYRTPAIVLQHRDFGEADRVYVLYTRVQGRTSAVARGVRKAGSKLGTHLDYFTELDLELARGRELDVITGVSTLDQHPGLRTDIDAYGHAAHLVELVRDLTEEHQENSRVYQLLAASLALLDSGVDPWHVARHFELGFLISSGYQPSIIDCAHCRRGLVAEPNAWSTEFGGMLCPECQGSDRAATLLSINAQKYLRSLAREGLSGVVRLDPAEDVRHEVSQALLTTLRAIGERDFSSLRVLGTMQGADQPSSRL